MGHSETLGTALEGHLGFLTPKRKRYEEHEHFEYLRQVNGTPQWNVQGRRIKEEQTGEKTKRDIKGQSHVNCGLSTQLSD